MKEERRDAPIVIASVRLYKTSDRRAFFSSSLARVHGVVSSMYLLLLLKMPKISVMASATRSFSILASAFFTASRTTAFKSASTSSAAPVFSTTPPKYLLVMETVRFTRFPRMFAKSEFMRSTINSHVITPSLSKGISWSTK